MKCTAFGKAVDMSLHSNLSGNHENAHRKNRTANVFDMFMIAVAALVILLTLLEVWMILFNGTPYILQAVQSEEVLFAVKLSIYTASVSTAVCMVLSIPTAYALTKTSLPLKRAAKILVELPLSMPYLVLGLSLLLLFSSGFGKLLSHWGFQAVFSVNGIILAHVVVNLPFVISMLGTAFEGVDPRLEFISRTLGASKARSFWSITLPLVKESVAGATILAWSRALGEFGATLMLVGVTRMKTETLPTSIYLDMATGDTGAAMASATILLLISAASLLLFNIINRKAGGRLRECQLK